MPDKGGASAAFPLDDECDIFGTKRKTIGSFGQLSRSLQATPVKDGAYPKAEHLCISIKR